MGFLATSTSYVERQQRVSLQPMLVQVAPLVELRAIYSNSSGAGGAPTYVSFNDEAFRLHSNGLFFRVAGESLSSSFVILVSYGIGTINVVLIITMQSSTNLRSKTQPRVKSHRYDSITLYFTRRHCWSGR
jgi:hypothetical protein